MTTKLNVIAEPIEREYNPGTDDEEVNPSDAWRIGLYDPNDKRMNPADPGWRPKEYFAKQPKDVIVINRTASDQLDDPTGNKPIIVPVSINGYILEIPKGRPVRVPRDFATFLVTIGAAYSQGSITEPNEF